jgi:hypothetical protein
VAILPPWFSPGESSQEVLEGFEFGPEVLGVVVDWLKSQGAVVQDDAIHGYDWE